MNKLIIIMIMCIALFGCKEANNTPQGPLIIFHASDCNGPCPAYHLQVNKDRTVKLFAEEVYKIDTPYVAFDLDSSKIGYFIGIACDTSFNKLTKELQNIGLDTLTFDDPRLCCDGPVITIIVYYDGKRKFLKSMWPPHKADHLISILYEICETSRLQRTVNKFEIESQ